MIDIDIDIIVNDFERIDKGNITEHVTWQGGIGDLAGIRSARDGRVFAARTKETFSSFSTNGSTRLFKNAAYGLDDEACPVLYMWDEIKS